MSLLLARVTKFLGISDAERPRLAALCALFFLLLISWALANCARSAYFLKEAGPDKLPYMYIAEALLMILAANGYARVVDKMSRHHFLILYLITASALSLAFRGLIALKLSWLPYALFIAADVVYMILYMHLWTFGNEVFDPREGKRLFPLVGAACSLAGIAGGFITKPLVAIIGTANLFVIWSAAMLAAIPIVLWIRKISPGGGAPKSASAQAAAEQPQGFSSLWSAPLIRTLTYIALPMWLIANVIDFQYFVALDEAFSDQDQLAGFLGLFGSVTALCGLSIQIFLAGKLLKRFGAGTTFLLYPLTLTSGAAALALRALLPVPAAAGLWNARSLGAVYAKLSDKAVYYSIADPASNLLFNALPSSRRGQGRAFINGTVKPLCTALAGGLLLAIKMTGAPLLPVSLAMTALGVLLVVLTLRLKKTYLETLIENMGSEDVDLKISAMNLLSQMRDSRTTELLLDALASANEQSALFSLELLTKTRGEGLAPRLCRILPKAQAKVKAAVLRALSALGSAAEAPLLAPFLEDPSPETRAAAVRTIGALGGASEKERLARFIDDPSLEVCAEACIAVIRADIGFKHHFRAVEKLRELSRSPSLAAQAKAAYVFGEVKLKRMLAALLNAAASADEALRHEAFGSIGKLGDQRAVPRLIGFLEDSRLTPQAEDAIVSLGRCVLKPLHEELVRPGAGNELKISVMRCLKRLAETESVPILARMLRERPAQEVLEAAVDALVQIKETAASGDFPPEFPALVSEFLAFLTGVLEADAADLRALKKSSQDAGGLLFCDALERSVRSAEETALRCLELLSDPETVRSASSRIRTGEPRALAEAFEVLEGSCPQSRGLISALEKKYFPEDAAAPLPEPAAALARGLSPGNPAWLRACAAFAVGELKISGFNARLAEMLKRSEPVLRGNAALALRKLGASIDENDNKEAGAMAINMQRVLFLRSVPLFSSVEGGDLQWISEICREREVSPDEVVFKEGSEMESLFIVMSGSVRVVKGLAKPVILSILQERDCFGEMAILEREKQPASIEAQTRAKLLVIARDDFQRLLLARPKILFALLKSMALQVRELQQEVLNVKSMADWFMKKRALAPNAAK